MIHAGSQFLDGDGRFPNHIPNPENKQAMEAGCRMVTDNGCDLGVVFDTDVDRSAVVASDGTPINSNRYIALMAYIALRCGASFPHHSSHPNHLKKNWHPRIELQNLNLKGHAPEQILSLISVATGNIRGAPL